MNQIYRYSRFHYLGLLILGLVGSLLVKGFLYEAFPVENFTYSIISILLAVLIVAGLIQYWRNIALKIITDPNSIVIRKPFKSVHLDWEEISEFGKFRRVVPPVGGNWVYYIKDAIQNKKIVLGVRGLENLEDLVLYILLKACKAKIVNIEVDENFKNKN